MSTSSAHHQHSLAALSVSRSLSISSVSSFLARTSSRPRSKLSGGGGDREQEDGALSAVNSDSSGSNATLWHCSYGCGKVYCKSSSRSIRRHVVSCFKVHWPGGAELSDSELSSLMAMQQDRGLLVTGLRRWKMRQSRRPANELTETEKWRCPWNCGKFYRSTGSRSIQSHATTCPNRTGNHAAEQGAPTSADSKRIKRQRDDEGGDEDGDNDEAEETTDSSSSAKSVNARRRTAAARSSHSKSSTTGNCSKPALRLHAHNDFSSSRMPPRPRQPHSSISPVSSVAFMLTALRTTLTSCTPTHTRAAALCPRLLRLLERRPRRRRTLCCRLRSAKSRCSCSICCATSTVDTAGTIRCSSLR